MRGRGWSSVSPGECVAVVLMGARLGHEGTRVGSNLGLGFEYERDWEVESEIES